MRTVALLGSALLLVQAWVAALLIYPGSLAGIPWWVPALLGAECLGYLIGRSDAA